MASGDQSNKSKSPVSLSLEKEYNGMFLPMKLGNKMIRFLVDTGACWSLMSMEAVEQCGLGDNVTVGQEGGLVTLGLLEVNAECQGHGLYFLVAVLGRLDTPLLGMNFFLRYGCMLLLDPEMPIMKVRASRNFKTGLLSGVYKKCTLEGHSVTAILDTGSTHSFISQSLVKEFKLKRRVSRPMLVTVFDGSLTVMFRKVKKANITIDGLMFKTNLIIHPSREVSLLLGMNVLSGSTLCLKDMTITFDESNATCVGGKQNPQPSTFTLTPPLFSVLSSSSRFITTTKRKGGIRRWFKFLRYFRWPECVGLGSDASKKGGRIEHGFDIGTEAEDSTSNNLKSETVQKIKSTETEERKEDEKESETGSLQN